MVRRDIVRAFFNDAFALTGGRVRATSFKKRSSLSEADCFAFITKRSIAARLAGIGRVSSSVTCVLLTGHSYRRPWAISMKRTSLRLSGHDAWPPTLP